MKKRLVTDRELNTVLAALRVLQANPSLFPQEFRLLKPLAASSIDKLCRDLNFGRVKL